MKKIRFPQWTIPIALLGICLLSYGLLIPHLGFYWDDWTYLYSYHVFGPLGYKAFVSGDRPLSYFIYVLTTGLFGTRPLGYHILNLSLRWGTSVAVWWAMGVFWPGRRDRLIWVPFLFAAYPGFSGQPIPLIYSLHWTNYLQSVISLGLMAIAVRETRKGRYWLLTGAAVILALNVFSLEYHFGLEVLRPLLIWIILSETIPGLRKRLLVTIRHWAPYLLVSIGYLVWRVGLFHSNMYQPEVLDRFSASPIIGPWHLIQTMIQDIFKVSAVIWTRVFEPLASLSFDTLTNKFTWGVVILSGVLVAIYLFRLERKISEGNRWIGQVILVGGVAVLSAGIPFWSSGLPIQLYFPFDRFTLPFILGVSILLGGMLEWIVHTERQKIIVLAVMVGFACGWHFENSNSFRRDWENMKLFQWQMAWRVPGLLPGTTVMTNNLPFNYFTDNSLTGPLNWMYAPDQKSNQLDYLMLLSRARLGGSLTSINKDTPINKTIRSFQFTGNTSQTLLYYYSPPGCLRILDPLHHHEYQDLPVDLQDLVSLGRLDVILPQAHPPASPPTQNFNPEPSHNWCYAFEKADLARQQGDWAQVVKIGDQALAQYGLPAVLNEMGVFIEGYARQGQVNVASAWSQKIMEKDPHSSSFICSTWQYLVAQNVVKPQQVGSILNQLHCPRN